MKRGNMSSLSTTGASSSSSSSGSSFADWLNRQKALQSAEANPLEESSYLSIFSKFSAIQDTVTIQFQDLSGSLPEAGVLSSAYRQRITHAIYLVIASAVFVLLAVVVGIPTILLRPSKFVICMTLATLLAASSVVVMQKPSVFISSIVTGGLEKSAPVAALFLSIFFTLYVTIFVHRYLSILFAGGIQLLSLVYYLASFIPGGTKGVLLLLRTTYTIVATAMKPVIYIVKSTVLTCLTKLFAS